MNDSERGKALQSLAYDIFTSPTLSKADCDARLDAIVDTANDVPDDLSISDDLDDSKAIIGELAKLRYAENGDDNFHDSFEDVVETIVIARHIAKHGQLP